MRRLWLLVCMCIFLTGCWDKIEIDNRIYVLAMGLDKINEDMPLEKKIFDLEPNRIKGTFNYPNIGTIAGEGVGESKFTKIATGIDFTDIVKIFTTRLSGVLTFDHTKLIVLGEELAKDEMLFKEILDTIERSPEIGRGINLMVTKGEAEEILSTELSAAEHFLGLFIRDLIDKQTRMARTADADMGYILRTFHESNATVIPRISASEDELIVAGAGVFKNFRLVGWLGETETKMLMFMLNRIDTATFSLKIDEKFISVLSPYSRTKMKVFERDGKIVVSFDIKVEGSLVQHQFGERGETYEIDYLNRVNKEIEKQLKEGIITTYKKIQSEYNADLVQAGEYLRKHEPDLWEKIEEDWDNIFPQTQVEVKVNMEIRRIGATR
ncbi:MAG: Ger(x)C family spore germination protein [Christensenellales bacterium]|jgi:spore germination protein KC